MYVLVVLVKLFEAVCRILGYMGVQDKASKVVRLWALFALLDATSSRAKIVPNRPTGHRSIRRIPSFMFVSTGTFL